MTITCPDCDGDGTIGAGTCAYCDGTGTISDRPSGLPVDRGWWTTPHGVRRLLSWWPDTGVLTLDGPGGVRVIATIPNRTQLDLILNGWADQCDQPDGLAWLNERLLEARAKL
ncbi:MAG: hypothetical protein LC798_19190 [Chloroflexi bacterium]|nr:hypothetical protein [Chloroflexota bacterium]